MNILMISTLAHNPGDEFIRLGLEHALRLVIPDASFTTVHKHDPRTLYRSFVQRRRTPHRLFAPMLYWLYRTTYGRTQSNRLDEADVVVFAGAPFIWRTSVKLFRSTSANAEWVAATWNRLIHQDNKSLVLNLSAGTSVTNQEQFDSILADRTLRNFLKKAVNRATLTTARDVRTRDILAALGFQADIIPCASIMAAKGAGLSPAPPEYVVVNLMPSAAHSWRGQRGHSSHWRKTITAAVPEIAKRNDILFVSHSLDEHKAAAEWFPEHKRFFSKDPLELLQVYSKALYGVCNRIHAGAAIASFGRPAIVIGGDSRINLIEQFGLPAYDHRFLDSSGLIHIINKVEQEYDDYARDLSANIQSAELAYVDAIRQAVVSNDRVQAIMSCS